MKNLVIVESPAKAKTIEGYLGKDFTVKSSYGHVRDLPKNNHSIDVEHGFVPRYEITEDKKKVVDELRKLSGKAECVWLATDDDREGEAISWHLKEALDLPEAKTKRIVFREITKPAILGAIDKPRSINMELVNAQQARRVLDRLVGFELSPILWKKLKAGLSAGRVQSAALRLVVDREREIEKFQAEREFKVIAILKAPNGKNFKAELPRKIQTEADATTFLESCIHAILKVDDLEVKPVKRTPAAPFTTSTLQQEASRKLGYSVSRTMRLAQQLYEQGFITYMRTDSTGLSQLALGAAKEEITRRYGADYSKTRQYKTKSESAQEAHEAIRPTDFSRTHTGVADLEKLYELIWKRTVASQMADAELERTIAHIAIERTTAETKAKAQAFAKDRLTATGEIIRFEGFLKVYVEGNDQDNDEEESATLLPPLEPGMEVKTQTIEATERFSRPAARFTEASLVKKLEEMGIGRPSTYAPTISTIMDREYVNKESRDGKPRAYRKLILENNILSKKDLSEMAGGDKNKLFPTDIGMVVTDFLVQYFPGIVDLTFTAQVEKEFDEIAHGGLEWQYMIDRFYGAFHKTVDDASHLDRISVSTTRLIGVDPATGLNMYAKLGRFGPVVQIGETESDQKPRFASLKKEQRIETITLEEALDLFSLPRAVGQYEGAEMIVGAGRFGPYVRHEGKFYSLPKGDDPLSLTEVRAIEIIEEKRLKDSQKLIKEFAQEPELKILNGRWGPYLSFKGENYKIPKNTEAAALSLDECRSIIESQASSASPAKSKSKKVAPAKTAKATKTTKSSAGAKPKSSSRTKK